MIFLAKKSKRIYTAIQPQEIKRGDYFLFKSFLNIKSKDKFSYLIINIHVYQIIHSLNSKCLKCFLLVLPLFFGPPLSVHLLKHGLKYFPLNAAFFSIYYKISWWCDSSPQPLYQKEESEKNFRKKFCDTSQETLRSSQD